MRHILALLAALALPSTALRAEEVLLAGPVFGEIVAHEVPADFVIAYEASDAADYIHEAIPAGETLDRWTQMITLSASKDAGSTPPVEMARQLGANYEAACPGTMAGVNIGRFEVPEGRVARAWYLGCGRVGGTDHSEQMVFLVIVGGRNLYTLQWAARGPALDRAPDPALDRVLWQQRLDVLLGGLRICDEVPGEAPPYPSCVD